MEAPYEAHSPRNGVTVEANREEGIPCGPRRGKNELSLVEYHNVPPQGGSSGLGSWGSELGQRRPRATLIELTPWQEMLECTI